jgi:Ca2+-binding RTX toxin-like protein
LTFESNWLLAGGSGLGSQYGFSFAIGSHTFESFGEFEVDGSQLPNYVQLQTTSGGPRIGSSGTGFVDGTPDSSMIQPVLGLWTSGSGSFFQAQVDLSEQPPQYFITYGHLTSLSEPVTASLKNDTGSSSTDNISSDATLTGSGGSIPGAVVTLTIDGHSPVTATADGLGAWNYSPSGLADGNHTVVVTETDSAGNAGTASLTFTLDTTTPLVTISGTGGLTNHSTQTISGNVVDLTAVGTTVSILDGSAVVGTTVVKSDGSWSDSITLTGDGTHKLTAQDTDVAGNIGTSNAVTFTLDTTAPVPTITNETLSHGKVTLAGTTAEANDTISVYDGLNPLGTVTTDSNGNWNFVTGQVSNTVHVYTASATDPAGNVGNSPNEAILGSTKTDTLVGGPGNDLIIGNGGGDTFIGGGGADMLFGGSGHDTFVFNAISDSTPASHDTIVSFNHTTDQIEFANIAGITGSNGVPTFEGKLAGSGNLTLNAHSVGYIEAGGNTEVLVNTTASAESVTLSDPCGKHGDCFDRDSPRADEPRLSPPLIAARCRCWDGDVVGDVGGPSRSTRSTPSGCWSWSPSWRWSTSSIHSGSRSSASCASGSIAPACSAATRRSASEVRQKLRDDQPPPSLALLRRCSIHCMCARHSTIRHFAFSLTTTQS